VPPELTRRIGVYGLCAVRDTILLTRLSRLEPDHGMWTLPGGGREHGESHRETLVREFDEETSLQPEVGGLIGVRTHVHPPNERRGRLHVVQYVYEARAEGDPTVREVGGSTAEAAWVPLGDAFGLPLVDLARWAVRRAAGDHPDGPGRKGSIGTIRA
jgi:8-oxo-dGTP diphosphatase